MSTTALVGGTVINGGEGGTPGMHRCDVMIEGDSIVGIGHDFAGTADTTVDCRDRFIMPGFVDVHSHGDGTVFAPEVALALLRQGITTIIAGQDGVSFAPGAGRYAREYFGPLNGDNVHYRGGGVGALLDTYHEKVPVNVGYLIPAGTVRYEVIGDANRTATPQELKMMVELVELGMRDGALGLSSGLDYVPGVFANSTELSALCRPVAARDGLHVSHMRGGYEENSPGGIAELVEIYQGTGVRTHVSHFHGPPLVVCEIADKLLLEGVPFTFDAYPYTRGCTLLCMLLLEPDFLALGSTRVAAQLAAPDRRSELIEQTIARVAERRDLGSDWASSVVISHVTRDEWAWVVGMTVADAARLRDTTAERLAFSLLSDCQLAVTAVVANPHERSTDDLASILTHSAHMAGSDGIYVGNHPHPRGWGSFARFLGRHTRDRGDYDWPTAVDHLSARASGVFRLGRRGRVEAGYAADLAIVDPASVSDVADYAQPRALAVGIRDVFVGGRQALRDGELTSARSGVGLRRAPAHPGARGTINVMDTEQVLGMENYG